MKITFRIWVLIAFVLLSLISIFSIPPMIFEKGVLVSSVEQNSSIFEDGLRDGMQITSINGQEVDSLADYSLAMDSFHNLGENETQKLTIQTKTIEIINLYDSSIIEDVMVEEIPSTNSPYLPHSVCNPCTCTDSVSPRRV